LLIIYLFLDESNVTETVFETNKNNSKNIIAESPVLKIAEGSNIFLVLMN